MRRRKSAAGEHAGPDAPDPSSVRKDIVMATRRSKNAEPNALEMLEEDHKKVQKLFKQFEKIDGDDEARAAIVEEAIAELRIHAAIEEQIFYPAAREALGEDEDNEDLLNEAAVEHESAKTLMEKLETMEPSDPLFSATFTVLGEYVSHHIEEEESQLFPKAKKAKMDLEGLAEELREAKQQMLAEMGLETPGEDEEVEAEEAPVAEAKKGSAQRSARSGR
jgi:hemerythrin-like domain-containing protein